MFSEIWHGFTNWGVGQLLSIIISLLIIVFSLPFTYVGYCINRAIWFRIKKYQGYLVKKYIIHAFISTILLLIIELILYFVLSISMFYSISFIISCIVFLGLMGVKLTFSFEKMIEGMFE